MIINSVIFYSPPCNLDAPLKMITFDSWYDRFRGAVVNIAVLDGVITRRKVTYLFLTCTFYLPFPCLYLFTYLFFTSAQLAGAVEYTNCISANG